MVLQKNQTLPFKNPEKEQFAVSIGLEQFVASIGQEQFVDFFQNWIWHPNFGALMIFFQILTFFNKINAAILARF